MAIWYDNTLTNRASINETISFQGIGAINGTSVINGTKWIYGTIAGLNNESTFLYYSNDYSNIAIANTTSKYCWYQTQPTHKKNCTNYGNMIYHWTLDDNSNETIAWDSVQGYNLTYTKGYHISGEFGNAFYSNESVNSRLTSMKPLDSNWKGVGQGNITVAYWVRNATTNTPLGVESGNQDTGAIDNAVECRIQNSSTIGLLQGKFFNCPIDTVTKLNLDMSQWHHVACTYEGGGVDQLKFYIDGIYVGGAGRDCGNDENFTLYVARSGTGDVDDIRLYNASLTANQISNLYNSSKTYLGIGVIFSEIYNITPTSYTSVINRSASDIFNISVIQDAHNTYEFNVSDATDNNFTITYTPSKANITQKGLQNFETNITVNKTATFGTYNFNINITREDGNVTLLPLTITISSSKIGNIEIAKVDLSKSMYYNQNYSKVWLVNNSGLGNLTGCNISFDGTLNGTSFTKLLPSSFTLISAQERNITITFDNPAVGIYSGHLNVKCATGGGVDEIVATKRPFVDLTVTKPSSLPPSGGGGGGPTIIENITLTEFTTRPPFISKYFLYWPIESELNINTETVEASFPLKACYSSSDELTCKIILNKAIVTYAYDDDTILKDYFKGSFYIENNEGAIKEVTAEYKIINVGAYYKFGNPIRVPKIDALNYILKCKDGNAYGIRYYFIIAIILIIIGVSYFITKD